MKDPETATPTLKDVLAGAGGTSRYFIQLFVNGASPRSYRAIRNIRTLCEQRLLGRYDLEVVDILQHPEMANPKEILVTPTVVRRLPLPMLRVVGDFSDQDRVVVRLDLVGRDTPLAHPAVK